MWFGDWSDDEPLPTSPPQYALWWARDPQADEALRERFGAANRAARAGELDAWAETPRGALALVILLDQLTRNLHRDSGEMFSADERARAVVRRALAAGHEAHLAPIERYFLYMPLMHSEDLADHDLAMDKFGALLDEARRRESPRTSIYEVGLDFERGHRDIIARFGRYPHRNALLGRATTAEEAAFLEQPGSSYL